MTQSIGPRVPIRIPINLIEHIDTVRGWRSRSDYIRILIEADALGLSEKAAPISNRPRAPKDAPPPPDDRPQRAATYLRATMHDADDYIESNAAKFSSDPVE